ncbi:MULTISPECIES: hypothetical protein [Mesorhizobium]|uniref:Uncharacterized protein n=1 Tax=Mesorhizobium denitrificans TaxID=2294114 RepID=A0A371XE31_9HYPH|nr:MULTISPECIES: hypothetical protein [Mesorhizobium]RFC67490.1 hypothetical protein DY251_10850 [Mesorhizobium denitrificans]
MSYDTNRSRKVPYLSSAEFNPDVSSIAEARRAAIAFSLGETGHGPPDRKPHRGGLPDVDMSQIVQQPRRSWLERLFGAPRAVKQHHKPSSSAV